MIGDCAGGSRAFSIIHEDENLVAVNKSPGIAVGGDRWDREAPRLDTLLEAFLAEHSGGSSADTGRLFTVHRIDKDTSGLVVFAKNAKTHKTVSALFETRKAEKTYTAVIYGRPHWPGNITECAESLFVNTAKHLTIIDNCRGKASLTRFQLLLSSGNYSVVEARPATGRTHQIRVHLASLGCPIVCDPVYGRHSRSNGRANGGMEGVYLSSFKRNWRGDSAEERPLLARLGLHALRLELPLPNSERLCLEAPLSKDMAVLVKQMTKAAKI
ncbi:MAG: RluA family pseudouridine synthase [Treponema sp.]|jgi:RluA family pseudouridine synthase|nr:RluA family pseudouridine synthase [Treponema sp.]